MVTLEGQDLKEAKKYIKKAAEVSEKSICAVSKIGAVLTKNGKIIGEGFNGPSEKACSPCLFSLINKDVKTELCFAMHAEERAILDALEKGHDPKGATLYSTYVKNGNFFSTEDSFCAHCSRMFLESEIKEVVIPSKEEFVSYDVNEFYDLSFDKFIQKKYIM